MVLKKDYLIWGPQLQVWHKLSCLQDVSWYPIIFILFELNPRFNLINKPNVEFFLWEQSNLRPNTVNLVNNEG